jgi:type II secretory pathway pseudopilin PulG
MNRFPPSSRHHFSEGFTLIEVIVAIGVITMATVALVPVIASGMRTVGNTSESSRTLDMMEAISADLRGGLRSGQARSPRYSIPLESNSTGGIFLFTGDGVLAESAGSARYRVHLTFTTGSKTPVIQAARWHLRATWPAAAPAGKEQGAAEICGACQP